MFLKVNLIIFLGILYITLAIVFLSVPVFFIELGRSRDLIKGGLGLFLGIYILIERNFFSYSDLILLIVLTLLGLLFVFEIFLNRWNQLSDNEKNKFKTPSEYLKITYILKDTFNLGWNNMFSRKNKDITVQKKSSKKWVRANDNNQISSDSDQQPINSKVTLKVKNQTEEDIIDSEENLA